MAKSRMRYVCQTCAAEFPQWKGRCTNCGAWDSLEEIPEERPSANLARPSLMAAAWNRDVSPPRSVERESGQPRAAIMLSQIADTRVSRWESGFGELDRVLGGGIVPGSLVLIGGEPGIGKSTLLLQVVSQLSFDSRVLYVSAEESGQQVKLRAHRLFAAFESENEGNGESDATLEGEIEESPQLDATEGGFAELLDRQSHSDPEPEPDLESEQTDSNANSHEDNGVEPNFYLLPETDLEIILRELESLKPQLAVIDSIQTIYFASLTSAPGSVAQVRECTSALMQVAKRENITLFIVGHVTKEGSIAGPRVLEHLVDTVLFFEGDRFASHRLLRSMKNRFGATHEIGVFEMVAHGLREVPNPSELFLGSRDEVVSGTSTIVACEGTRPLVVELQALVSPASFGSPRRSSTGVDNNRLQQILAVLEKRVGVPLSKLDTYVASVGGINVQEPAADLGIAIAVVASFRDRIVDPHTVLIGEVGLGGQVRQVSQLEIRLREAAKLGFKRAIVPRSQIPPDLELETIQVTKVLDAILEAIPGSPNMPNVPPQPTASNNRPTLPVVEGELEDEDDDDDWEAETDLF